MSRTPSVIASRLWTRRPLNFAPPEASLLRFFGNRLSDTMAIKKTVVIIGRDRSTGRSFKLIQGATRPSRLFSHGQAKRWGGEGQGGGTASTSAPKSNIERPRLECHRILFSRGVFRIVLTGRATGTSPKIRKLISYSAMPLSCPPGPRRSHATS